jgi:hypothetical protein
LPYLRDIADFMDALQCEIERCPIREASSPDEYIASLAQALQQQYNMTLEFEQWLLGYALFALIQSAVQIEPNDEPMETPNEDS